VVWFAGDWSWQQIDFVLGEGAIIYGGKREQ